MAKNVLLNLSGSPPNSRDNSVSTGPSSPYFSGGTPIPHAPHENGYHDPSTYLAKIYSHAQQQLYEKAILKA